MAGTVDKMQEIPSYDQMERLVRAAEAQAANGGMAVADVLDRSMQELMDGTNTTNIFWAWYVRAKQSETNRFKLLERFGRMLEGSFGNKTYTIRKYDYTVSQDPTITPLDDLAAKAQPRLYTENDTSEDEWLDEDQATWYIRANAISLADGTMNIVAFEGEDGFDISGEAAPVYSFQVAWYVKEWGDGSYDYKSFRLQPAAGYEKRAEAIDPAGNRRPITWHPVFPGGLNSKGGLTSGAGIKPYNFVSAGEGITAARKTSAYEGLWSDQDTQFILDAWQLRHWNLENSNIAEGCTNYNYQYPLATAENGVKRVLVTTDQGKNFIVGSTVSVGERGTNTNNDRNQSYMRDKADLVRISSKEDVTVDGTTYTALNLDMDSTIDTTVTCYVSTMPWYSGVTEKLPVHKDGALVSLAGGKAPIRVAGIEMMHGAYDIGLDPLYNVTMNAENGKNVDYEVYTCRDSEKLATSITADYTDTKIGIKNLAPSVWLFVKKFVRNKLGIVFPEVIGGSSTGWYKSAFCSAGSAGVRCPWRFANLNDGGNAGLACENGNNDPGWANWNSRPRNSFAETNEGINCCNVHAYPCESKNQVIQKPPAEWRSALWGCTSAGRACG